MLKFDEATHTYTVNGSVIPSVTQIIDEWIEIRSLYVNRYTGIAVEKESFDKARDRGKKIHKMVHLALKNDLDIDSLSPEMEKVYDQFWDWFMIHRPKIIYSEEPMYSEKFGYAGTIDIVCEINKKVVVVDVKTGLYGMAGIQLAGYENLIKEWSKQWKTIPRYVLALPANGGSYKFKRMEKRTDWDTFKTMLALQNLMKF
ncbi:MAG: hypothetical protein U9N38_04955 [Thermodesulfobacteriota bacterium]|nr:hypothetical protein [Thermodesulfobacteriota bacterium]